MQQQCILTDISEYLYYISRSRFFRKEQCIHTTVDFFHPWFDPQMFWLLRSWLQRRLILQWSLIHTGNYMMWTPWPLNIMDDRTIWISPIKLVCTPARLRCVHQIHFCSSSHPDSSKMHCQLSFCLLFDWLMLSESERRVSTVCVEVCVQAFFFIMPLRAGAWLCLCPLPSVLAFLSVSRLPPSAL